MPQIVILLMDLGSQLKTSWKGFTILGTIKNIHESWEGIKISTLTGVGKKSIPTLMYNFEEFQISVEEETADLARDLELQMEPKDVTKLL